MVKYVFADLPKDIDVLGSIFVGMTKKHVMFINHACIKNFDQRMNISLSVCSFSVKSVHVCL